ncbi:MAG: DUF1549 domain-containing protein, partial [Verrucomicrobia bacterium]|nr:DUF1549 domain-containing protein [Verrucomicrobiota bacterium]
MNTKDATTRSEQDLPGCCLQFIPHRSSFLLLSCLSLWSPTLRGAAAMRIEFRTGAGVVALRSADARQQLLATGAGDLDLTGVVAWTVEPPGIASVDAAGRVTPRTDGEATIIARTAAGEEARLRVVVSGGDQPQPIHFANQIVPVFTKYGCNGGGCHGKASGQNGFRLSLLGFEPSEDYEHLVKEARGRRLFPAAPERSLLLTKSTAQLPHGGGRRMEPGSDDYNLLVRWISQGMPVGAADAPTVARLEVFPAGRTLPLNGGQQLVVTAHYTDGSTEDVTRSALYEPNDKDMASVDAFGRVTVFNQPGAVAVMVRYQSKVGVFRGTVPLGAPVTALPRSRNFVDDLVFAQWKRVGLPPSAVADDETFLRRVTLDLAGRLPTEPELAAFREDLRRRQETALPLSSDQRPQEPLPETAAARDAVIERLLASGDYADVFA